jgi:signal transduction histidine kinase/CheY-like chemotaxis protein
MSIISIMRTIPLSIVKYVHAWWMSELILTYLHVDHEGLLMSWGGHPRHYGLYNLETRQNAVEQLPFLEGLLPIKHTEVFEFIQVGNGRTAHIHLVPFRGGTWILLFDATAEHDRQQRMQQQLNELSLLTYRQTRLLQELETVAKSLQNDKQYLKEIADNKGRLISNLSHELRAPLTSIASYSRLLDNNAHQDYVDNVQSNANHLLALVDNILDQTQLESGRIVLQVGNCDPRQLLNELKTIFAPLAREKNLDLELIATPQLPFMLIVDELRLRQIFINLLNNAVKFTQSGTIRLTLDWQQSNLIFEVSDTGEGISPEGLERIFLPYHRETNQQSGVGLGLAITKQLVELMGGEIRVKSTRYKGTAFSGFISTHLGMRYDNDEDDDISSHNIKVLLAEDARSTHLLLVTYLKESGYTVLSAYNGAEAVALAESEQPKVILMDMQMPIMDGYTATRTLRERDFKNPIIALSASDLLEDREAAILAGCTHYLRKPVSPDMLLNLIKVVQT